MRTLILTLFLMSGAYAQPRIEPGVSQELARWRAERYSDVRYKLNLTIEKMSPVLIGTIEVRVKVAEQSVPPALAGGAAPAAIVLDWRKIKGHEEKSTISNVSINGRVSNAFEESNEHLIFRDGVVAGENVIKLDFTSPILPSGSAITRYIDKEDGSEYIYSLFVPSDASTAFPVFDQPDLKARFELLIDAPEGWNAVSNTPSSHNTDTVWVGFGGHGRTLNRFTFAGTKPISTYVFAFAAGPWQQVSVPSASAGGSDAAKKYPSAHADGTDSRRRVDDASGRGGNPTGREGFSRASKNPPAKAGGADLSSHIFVRKSQLTKFQPHAAEVFRLHREGIKFLEEYFAYKFPFPKYDLVLIPEFPFGGMEHAGATFVRESAVIFPSEPTANDHISRANLIFHEAAHQWFGDTVTMKWFDDLWLKEGFAEFMAYKTLERVMPQYNAWKAFYERNKPLAYATDSTKGTTPIYQEIKNLNSAKSAYGNIVYRKAPSFLKQAEFYLGPDKFQTAVRAFLKKHEFENAEWKELVYEFKNATWDGRVASAIAEDVQPDWTSNWIQKRGLPIFKLAPGKQMNELLLQQSNALNERVFWQQKTRLLTISESGKRDFRDLLVDNSVSKVASAVTLVSGRVGVGNDVAFIFPNYQDFGYGIFLLDDKSRAYVLKNIQNEKDNFLRSMMWGALWDSVREGELDPKEYVELATRNLPAEKDETITASVLSRVATAINYYLGDTARAALTLPLEQMLEREMLNAGPLGRRITFYRGFLSVGASIRAREVYKKILHGKFWPKPSVMGGLIIGENTEIPLKAKDRFDIVTRLASLGDPEAEKLLAELEETETSDDAKRYAYAARAAFPTKETKEKYWNDFVNNKQISESWIEAAFGPFNSVRQADLTLPYLERALNELPNHKRNRKIFFVNGWLAAFIGGQKSDEALAIVNKFLADNPNLDRDLRLKILENVDVIERAVKIRGKFATR